MATTTQLRFASAVSGQPGTAAALDELLTQLHRQLDGHADLVAAFLTAEHAEHLPLIREQIQRAVQPGLFVAVTAEGVLGAGRELYRRTGLSILAASLPGVALRAFHLEELDWPAILETPTRLRQPLMGPDTDDDAPDPAGLILLADPFSTPIARLLPAMQQALPATPIVGGMLSAARQPGGNHLVLNGQSWRQGAIGITVAGDIQIDSTVSQGCRPLGRPMIITRAQRHVIQQLGGRPAVQVARDLMEQLSEADRAAVRTRGLLLGRVIDEYKPRFGRGDFLIRNLLGFDPEQGYLAVNDTQIRIGQTVQFHLHDRQTAIEDMRLLLESQKLHDAPAGALLFSCNGRGQNLFGDEVNDAGMIEEALPSLPLAGFFAAGEIGPIGGQSFIHGHTAALAVFRPRDNI